MPQLFSRSQRLLLATPFTLVAPLLLSTAAFANTGTVQLSSGSLRVRDSANTNGEVLFRLRNGAGVRLLCLKNDWFNISVGGKIGWVSSSYVEVDDISARIPQCAETSLRVSETTSRSSSGNAPSDFDSWSKDQKLAFIRNPRKSTLDLLGPRGLEWKRFEWHKQDYPGGKRGPNESNAKSLFKALGKIRPERRVSRGKYQLPGNASTYAILAEKLEVIPNGTNRTHKLHSEALQSFIVMRDEARLDGVELKLHSGRKTAYRTLEDQAGLGRGNTSAVAKATYRAPHVLGVAIDLAMSWKGLPETTTTPFKNVVEMRSSPVHKWMFFFGKDFGWYPFTNEPWHWEYNPPGFKARYP